MIKEMSLYDRIHKVLKKYWGYDELRDGQLQIIESIQAGKDTMAILPTGGGKSLCYQLPALLNSKITLVVSPLLALMRDQAYHLTQIGVKTCCLNSELRAMDLIRTLNDLESFEVIYTTPEYLLTNVKIITRLREADKLGLVAIDEAHCASAWGHDFRPSYLRLGEIRSILNINVNIKTGNLNNISKGPKILKKEISVSAISGFGFGIIPSLIFNQPEDGMEDHVKMNSGNFVNPINSVDSIDSLNSANSNSNSNRIPILALTATAPPSVIKDMSKILKLESPVLIVGDLGRKNLEIKCLRKTNPKDPAYDLARILDSNKNTIIYTIKKDETDLIYDKLSVARPDLIRDKKIDRYHADLSQEKKHEIYTKFIKGDITILIATIAFGMGIDKKDIRMIINWGAPSNLETYYQEIGRAGRDNLLSTCYLFWSDADLNLSRYHINKCTGTKTDGLAKESLRKINAMENFLRSTECRIGIVIRYLKAEFNIDSTKDNCYHCDRCDNCNIYNSSNLPNTSDYGSDAYLLFSLIRTLKMSYGVSTLIAILRGVNNQRMTQKLKNLDEFGQGSNRSEKWWKTFIKFLQSQNYLVKVPTNIQGNLYELIDLSPNAILWLNNASSNNHILKLRENSELITSSIVVKGHQHQKTILTSTIQESLNQIIKGKKISEIAKDRGLVSTTIEGHFTTALEIDRDLRQYLPGLGISNVRVDEMIEEIKTYKKNNPHSDLETLKLREVKENIFKNKYNYFEIKIGFVLSKP